ncbi:predicted protein [Methanosarcina acetivorans C2A]|uniref:Uncharacterized protein n=1 Tax=Methanosarcina acetivorans (strain ATCC 35395 / DSM 2834 / JCM 12185 / C2A) TaxID=188937 RepID=Q8TNL6_METAC|nr:predicted protein [Methanosarcina acetivorans C2A]
MDLRENSKGKGQIFRSHFSFKSIFFLLFVKSCQTSWRGRLCLTVNFYEVPEVKSVTLLMRKIESEKR